MRARTGPAARERVLVRHVLPARRDGIDRLTGLVRVPFARISTGTFPAACRDLSEVGPPSGRWAIAARFAGESWVSLFSNAATGKELFDANAGSRRMEVAWIGRQPEGPGWSFRLHSAGRPIVEFAHPDGIDAESTPLDADLDPARSEDRASGERTFRDLCASFEISTPVRTVRATGGSFQVIGAGGRPVKSALRGYLVIRGPEISKVESF